MALPVGATTLPSAARCPIKEAASAHHHIHTIQEIRAWHCVPCCLEGYSHNLRCIHHPVQEMYTCVLLQQRQLEV